MKAGPRPRCSTCVITVHFLNHTEERSHWLLLTRTEAQDGQALSLCSEVNLSATSLFGNASEDQRDSRYQRSSLFVIGHTGRCQVAGWEFLRGILETGAKFVLQDGLSFW